MKLLFYYLEVFYNLCRDHKRFINIVWERLKKYHLDGNFNSGFYEADKRVESYFKMSENVVLRFFYEVAEGKLKCRGRVLETFDSELTTELFVLATHFNNLLRKGKIIVDPDNLYVDLLLETDLAMIIIYPGELYREIENHFKFTKDVHWAFSQLVEEGEEPAIIIADLLKKNGESPSTNE
jgi:hypothetical protein